jgi:hypothetical protein
VGRGPPLLRLDVGTPDHLGPCVSVFDDKLSERGGRIDEGAAAQLGKPRFQLRIGQSGIDLHVELVDDLSRRVPR